MSLTSPRRPRIRSALLVLLACFWLGAGSLKFFAPDEAAFRQFFGSVFPRDSIALSRVYFLTAGAEIFLAISLLALPRSRAPATAGFALASTLLLLQVTLGVDSHCGCFGAVVLSWPVRLLLLTCLVLASYLSIRVAVCNWSEEAAR